MSEKNTDYGLQADGLDAVTVSGGDPAPPILFPEAPGGPMQAYALSVSPGDAAGGRALADRLGPLDFKLSCILFLLLFMWCERKIGAAVSKMTGRRWLL